MNKNIKKYQRIGDFAILEPNGTFFVIGEGYNDAVVISGTHHTKLLKSRIVSISQPSMNVDKHQKSALLSFKGDLWNLTFGSALANFSILSESRDIFRHSIKKSNATHIEFNCDDTSARAFPFDARSFDSNTLWNDAFISESEGILLSNYSGKNVTFVIKSNTFFDLPNEPYSMTIFEKDYAILSSANDGARVYIRDQSIRKPYTSFFNDRLEKQITLLFHPKS